MNRANSSSLTALLTLAWLSGCGSDRTGVPVPAERDAERVVVPEGCDGRGTPFALPVTASTDDGAFSVVLTRAEPPVFSLGDNAWTFRIEGRDGGVLTGKDPAVVPWMPDHRHGAPKTVVVESSGEGVYEARPINANMPGLWEIRVNLPGDGGGAGERRILFLRRRPMTPPGRHFRISALLLAACSGEPDDARTLPLDPPGLTEEELLTPASCTPCHPGHVEQWSASMHAYSSKDPVFLAMNRRGQEETSGELGDFCVQCHAPLALALGLTTDGLDLPELPESAQGVSCAFCHSAGSVFRDHNNGLTRATDGVLLGPIERPAVGARHESAYSPIHDGRAPESSDLCGSCHDVTLPNGVELERTGQEWRSSAFSPDHALSKAGVVTCAGCHMPEESAPSATGASTTERAHDHRFAAVDVALTPFPETGDPSDERLASEQRERVQSLLDTSLGVEICVEPMVGFQSVVHVTLENSSAGHHFPSGASQDRRVWLEVTAFDAAGAVLYASGTVAPDEGGEADPDLWAFHDLARKADDQPAHMFWETAKVEQRAIPAPATFDPSSADALLHHVTRRFPRSRTETIDGTVARVTATVRLRPIGLDVLGDLVDSGHLDATLRDRMPVFDLVPNRHLAGHSTLAALSESTFEWSDAVRDSGRFATRILNDGAFPRYCVGTTARR